MDDLRAFLVTLHGLAGHNVTAHIVMFGRTEDEVEEAAKIMHRNHDCIFVERANWLDKPD